MNNEANYIKWKLCFNLSLRFQTMSNSCFSTKLIFKPTLLVFNSNSNLHQINYLVNGKIWLNTRTFTSRTIIGISIHAAWVYPALYRDCMSYYVSEL